MVDATGPLLQGRCCRIMRWRDGLKTEEAGTEWWWWCGVWWLWWHWTPPRNLFLSPVIIPPSSVRLWRWCRTGLQTTGVSGPSLCGEYSTHSHQSPLLCTYLLTSTMGPFDRNKWIKVNKKTQVDLVVHFSDWYQPSENWSNYKTKSSPVSFTRGPRTPCFSEQPRYKYGI